MKRISPLKAIRLKCLDCSCDSAKEVKLCEFKECPLYIYRLGKNPYLKGTRKGSGDILRKYRENQKNNTANGKKNVE